VRRLLPILPLLLLVAALGACSGSAAGPDGNGGGSSPTTPQAAVSSPSPCSDQAEHPFVITMRDDRFVPSCLVVSGVVPFRVRNRGSREHNLTIPGTGFSVDVPPGHSVSRAPLLHSGVPPGTYRFYCRFHRSRGMTGELHVLAA
jgi:plastocyanin